MIISQETLQIKDMKVGMVVYLNEDNAKYFSLPYQYGSNESMKDYVFPHGLYRITKLEDRPKNPNLIERACPRKIVTCHYHTWPEDSNGLPIVYNAASQAICDGSILIENALSIVIRDSKDLDIANQGRFECAGCGKTLNIVSANLRICRGCEDFLEQYTGQEEPQEKDGEELDLLDSLDLADFLSP